MHMNTHAYTHVCVQSLRLVSSQVPPSISQTTQAKVQQLQHTHIRSHNACLIATIFIPLLLSNCGNFM